MINAEKHKNELRTLNELKKLCNCALRKDNGAFGSCSDVGCENCMFNDDEGCSYARFKWLLSEYKEKIILSKFERDILEWAYNECLEYITRDKDGNLYAHPSKPDKISGAWDCCDGVGDLTVFNKLFDFIEWEDTEPRSIEKLLKNCEVLEK